MSRCESPLGQPSRLSVLVSFPVAMIEYSDKNQFKAEVYPSPWGQISVPHLREVKASGVQSKWLREQRTHVCVFGSLSRLSKGFIFFLFMCMCMCVHKLLEARNGHEFPAAGGTSHRCWELNSSPL